MKKKLIVFIFALVLIPISGIFAFGVGIQFNGNAGHVFEPGPALTFKADSIPFVFAINWNIGDTYNSFGVTADYWIVNNKLGNIGSVGINGFFGVGFFANTVFGNSFGINAGLRIPFGLNTYLGNGFFEPFVQVAPSFGLVFLPSLGFSNVFFPISAGFRMWF